MQRPVGREVGRHRVTGHVGVARRVHGDGGAEVRTGAAQVRGVVEGRIDDQRLRRVVRAHTEANLGGALDHVPTRDRLLNAIDALVNDRRLFNELLAPDRHDEVALRIDGKRTGALEVELDLVRVGAGGNVEVVLQLFHGGPVVDKVHPGIDVLVLDLGIVRDVGLPLLWVAAGKVVAGAGLRVKRGDLRRRPGGDDLHVEDRNLRPAGIGDGHRTVLPGRGCRRLCEHQDSIVLP